MNKQDIIRQFGEAMYQAALESARKNNFDSVDDLLVVNGEVEATEYFAFNLFDFIWDKKALSRRERLNFLFEIIEEFPLTSFFYRFEGIYVELSYIDREFLCTWCEKQLLKGVSYAETLENALGVGIFERGDIGKEVWNFFVRDDTPPEILKFVLSVAGVTPYAIKKKLYNRLLSDKTWHLYIFLNLYASLFWYGGLNKEDAKKVYAQLEIPAGYERYQATFVEGIEGYNEVKPPEKLPSRKKKKRYKDWDI
jgi:hypothetical protein